MSRFIEIAEPLAKLNVPVTPVRAGTKRAFLPDFPTTATTDLNQIMQWDALYPDSNVACVARAEVGGIWLWEVDSKEVAERLNKDTGHDIEELYNTFRVRSRPGRGHFYFRHNATSMSLGNISQTYVVGQDWSARTNREYVVGPGSIHPDTQRPYTALNNNPILEAPDWLINWLVSQKIQKQTGNRTAGAADNVPRNAEGKVKQGSIHGFMLTQAGRMRRAGLNQDEIETALLRIVHEQCEPPIDDEKVKTMAKSICNFPVGEDKSLAMSSQIPATAPVPATLPNTSYPTFPTWVMEGTSIYEGFAKPYCDANARVDYFMWMPAAAMMMNYLGGKVSVPYKGWKPSFYIFVVGRKSRTKKSSSIKDAMKYLEHASVLSMYSKNLKNADGKSVVWEAGSAEGVGTDVQRVNCKNIVLFYDELSKLVAKANIQGASLKDMLLKFYESNAFGNSIKAKKDTFNLDADTYTASLITSTTTRSFGPLWGLLSDGADGIESRSTFILEPKELPSMKPQQTVDFREAAGKTKALIDRAVEKRHYEFFDQTPLSRFLNECGEDDRVEIRAEKWALYFAIDLGLDEIDEDCVERGIAVSRYELAVKKFLMTMEAKSELAALQQDIVRKLSYHGGQMKLGALKKDVEAQRFDTFFWWKAYSGLIQAGNLVETPAEGAKAGMNSAMVTLVEGFPVEGEDE